MKKDNISFIPLNCNNLFDKKRKKENKYIRR